MTDLNQNNFAFPETAPTANPVFYRTYSRRINEERETPGEVFDRTTKGLIELGKLTDEEGQLILQMQKEMKALTSGRWLWVGGTEWVEKPENFYGSYNCSSTRIVDWKSFSLMMNLAMQGCGTGAMLEHKFISRLPVIINQLNIRISGDYGQIPKEKRIDETIMFDDGEFVNIIVGDSRQGWVDAYEEVLKMSSDENFPDQDRAINVIVDISHVRPEGEELKGFGGIANPKLLKEMFPRIAKILNGAIGRKLTAKECCLLIDEPAKVVVAGSIRRSAGMRQFNETEPVYKLNLWVEDEDGQWRIDPERDAMRMANHTRVYHHKPTEQECIEAVRLQFQSGEGAIQYAPEAIARANADILNTPEKKNEFIAAYLHSKTSAYNVLVKYGQVVLPDDEVGHRFSRYGLNPCGEILGEDFHCNLSEVHLNQIDPRNMKDQESAFTAAALSVAALLNHHFTEPRYQKSRDLDPIVGVSFTGLFDFFVHAFGVEWLHWWEDGRPDTVAGLKFKQREQEYLSYWQEIVHRVVWEYCDRHGLKRPNRCTTVQPAGTKSLLTGASPGWHPPKAQRFIRRITFRKNDPVALACIDYGYHVVPSQSDKDDQGNLLNDPFDPRCTEWLVEIPVEVSWANLPGADTIAIEKFSALAQFDFYMQVQKYYTAHNTSATIELTEAEVEPLAHRIHQAIANDEGYISAALLARYDAPYPRLPFEKIDKETYDRLHSEVLARRKIDDFHSALSTHDSGYKAEEGPAGCDSDKCMLPIR